MGKENEVGVRLAVSFVLLTQGLVSCGDHEIDTEEKKASATTQPPATELVPTASPTNTLSPTPTFVPTETPTPIPNYDKINEQMLNESLEGDVVVLENINLNKVVVVNPPLRDEMFFGLITNNDGKTQEIIENIDCQFKTLREKGLLGQQKDSPPSPLSIKIWEPGVVFDEIQVVKNSDITGEIGLFTSESFIFDGEEEFCEKVSSAERFGSFSKELLEEALKSIIRLSDEIGD
jgi:hypothetical protein